MASDDELKDEELVDFEGSDYDIDGDYEELEEEEEEGGGGVGGNEVVTQQPADLVQKELTDEDARHSSSNGALMNPRSSDSESSKVTQRPAEPPLETLNEQQKGALEVAETLEAPERSGNGVSKSQKAIGFTIASSTRVPTSTQKASESTCQVPSEVPIGNQSATVESSCVMKFVEEDIGAQNQRDGNAILGPAPNMHSNVGGAHDMSEHVEKRPALLSSKPDLEDGELDETAVPQNYGLSAEEEVIDETFGREKKRKKESSGMERHVDGAECYTIKHMEETGDAAGKEHHSTDSDKATEHFAGFACAGGRGMGLKMIGVGQGSLAPGIMGPGRPLIPLGIGNLTQGFYPFGGITSHGQPQVHLQEVLAQEHLLRAHALQLAQETLSNAIRSPLTRPLGAAALQPFMAFDVPGPRSHVSKHFPRPSPDMLIGPIGSFARCLRPNLPAGRAGKIVGQSNSNLYTGMRQFGWPTASGPNEVQILKRGRGRGRGLHTAVWGDVTDSFGPVPGGIGSAGSSHAILNAAAPLSMRHLNSDDIVFYQTPLGMSPGENDLLHNGFDARWKIEKERMLRNGLPHLRMPDKSMVVENLSEDSRELVKESGKYGEVKAPLLQGSTKTGSLSARLGPPAQTKVATSIDAHSGDLAVPSSVIKLHQPVRKSRVLIVSGLPEDTPISTVVEVFEKLGKITDFKKSTKGGVFTISYSSETEAVTAKRNLHRSCLAGKQITVDYSHL